MGRLRESVRQSHTARHGEEKWAEHVKTVASLWSEIRRGIFALGIDPRHLRLYQDGLPICGREAAIVADLAEAGSENHRLLKELMASGAVIEGTEAPELLLQEYELALKILNGQGATITPEAARNLEQYGRELLQRRDRFIAQRIDQTLQTDETGLIFLGMLHSLPTHLPSDIQVDQLNLNVVPKQTDGR